MCDVIIAPIRRAAEMCSLLYTAAEYRKLHEFCIQFRRSAPATWNSLPRTASTDSDTLRSFKSNLKTLFSVLPSVHLTVTSPFAGASEVTTVWRYRNENIINDYRTSNQ